MQERKQKKMIAYVIATQRIEKKNKSQNYSYTYITFQTNLFKQCLPESKRKCYIVYILST